MTATPEFVIGSRGSQLALWQAHWIAARLKDLGAGSRIEVIKTTGDKITEVALSKVGGKGLFTKELEQALLDGSIDIAVHSLKDLPTELPAGLTLAAVPEREDPCDAMVGATLDAIVPGSRVGTSSLRRAAQLRALRPDLEIRDVRGNLDTRLRKLDDGQYDALVLAAAGLRRLGWASRISDLLPPSTMCPAVGQGALGIETRDSGPAHDICARLEHPATRSAVTAERALLLELQGGCQVPLGAHATIREGMLHLVGVVASPDGSRRIHGEESASPAEAAALGIRLARRLLDDGARDILETVRQAEQ